ncbi:tetratricopeptide repeat protein [Sphingomonas fuzhouensis]|uniref:tetratricopeptide repeat protein n=1 Tax=Sphingomonas fuzhouensis TaxID=3106033 RepID=UPI002AFDEF3A|nr:tetratricopeptide repeat protein [Sphingomonas sp. SGZ-02]
MPDYDQLAAFLKADPDNAALIADMARAALDAGRADEAAALAARHRALAGPTPAMDHVAGLAAMAAQDWPAATTAFRNLLDKGVDQPAVRYNLAWSLMMTGDKDAALASLDDDTAHHIPQAAQLLVGLLHERGEMERAEAVARNAVARFPDHRGLNAAVSTLAIDLADLDLARETAARAGGHPEALVTQATLALEEDNIADAGALFEAALTRHPDSPRALVGRGLVALASDRRTDALADLDRGAALFGTHLGSWIAAGWAHVLAGDTDAARERFERAAAIDDSFAEAHGSLAVLDLMAGDAAAGQQRTAIAQRLDRESFSGALAAAMLAAGGGDRDRAERIVTLALSTPIDGQGRTIGQALTRLGAF